MTITNLLHDIAQVSPGDTQDDDLPAIPDGPREIILDRLEEGFNSGLLRLTRDEYTDVLACLLPEDFFVVKTADLPSFDPPGSPGRIDRYCRRAYAGALHIIGDAVPGATDRTMAKAPRRDGVEGRQRNNGTGIRAIGWVSPGDTQGVNIYPGMYRDAAGTWFDISE